MGGTEFARGSRVRWVVDLIGVAITGSLLQAARAILASTLGERLSVCKTTQ